MKGSMTNFLKINMKDEQIRVFYKMEEQINSEFDRELCELCEKYGFEWWASGFDLGEEIRDIAFEKKEGNKEPHEVHGYEMTREKEIPSGE